MGPADLPANVLAQAVASATVHRIDPSVRWISFSGYDWWVKDSSGLIGPGPNYFSDSTNNVFIDDLGRLHLHITLRSNQWQCAEVVTKRTFGFGNYRFELDSPVNDIDSNVILGLFTWSDDPAYTHREIDVECGRWTNPNDVNNAQFVVQPWDWMNHLVRYPVPAGLTNSTHCFIWESNRIRFEALRGPYVPNPPPSNFISASIFNRVAEVPQTGDENVRINLWLYNGSAPTDNSEAEFIVKSFQFVPLGQPLPAVLLSPRYTNGYLTFDVSGQSDWRYAVQSSTNCSDWQSLGTLLATNNLMSFTAGNTAGASRRFFRMLTLP
jgi:hypothetical protein